jgi:hypothetical protein
VRHAIPATYPSREYPASGGLGVIELLHLQHATRFRRFTIGASSRQRVDS